MPTTGPNLEASKLKSLFEQSFQLDFKALFKALSKGLTHVATGKWAEAGNDAVEALCAIGLAADPGELARLLVHRSLVKATFDLMGESVNLLSDKTERDSDALLEHLDFSISTRAFHIDRQFLDRPSTLPLVADIQPLIQAWLEGHDASVPSAKAVAARFPSYFTFALHQEWRRNAKSYAALKEALDTPFAKASEREWAWMEYASMLQRRIEEGVFDEPFSLRQIYVPLNATYLEEPARGMLVGRVI
jgi:hypothetical protein